MLLSSLICSPPPCHYVHTSPPCHSVYTPPHCCATNLSFTATFPQPFLKVLFSSGFLSFVYSDCCVSQWTFNLEFKFHTSELSPAFLLSIGPQTTWLFIDNALETIDNQLALARACKVIST